MNKLIFATNNNNKIIEVKQLLNNFFTILSLSDINCNEAIPETSPTIKENAMQKARYVFEQYGYNCFADDTGLEIDALNGEPGVLSARYAGEDRNDDNNIKKVLQNLTSIEQRTARFKTVFALIINDNISCFEGIVNGNITTSRIGKGGFGYDSIFIPLGYHQTFAEMSLSEKNKISHRGIAFEKLIKFLNKKRVW